MVIISNNLKERFSSALVQLELCLNCQTLVIGILSNHCHSTHLMTMLCSRFVSFISSSENSSEICIRLLLNLLKFDQRSVTAKNLRNIADKCNKDLNIIDQRIVNNCMIFQEIPLEEEWRIPFFMN